jgi:antitoxin MazE
VWEGLEMQRKVFRTGNSIVVSLPKDALDFLGITEGSEVTVELDKERKRLVIAPAQPGLSVIGEDFARQVSEFIERYRPALEALAK